MQNYFHHKKEGDFTPHILKPEFKLPTYLNIELHDIHTLTTVSYTHLDVYKRQEY